MGTKSSVSILCLLIISFSPIYVSAQTCDGAAGTFKPNSPYENNRRLFNSTLASNVTANDGYFSGSIGLGADRVYSLGMCSPGAEPHACSYCIQDASNSVLQSCPNQTDASEWSGDYMICVVRYSRESFSGVLVLEPHDKFFNPAEIEEENQKEFYGVWDVSMTRMIIRASGKHYAKEELPVPFYGNILVLMQCTQDISSKNCSVCLERSVEYYKEYLHGKKGAIIFRPSCIFRWEFYNFSGVSDHTSDRYPPALSPLKSPSIANLTNIITKKGKWILENISAAILLDHD